MANNNQLTEAHKALLTENQIDLIEWMIECGSVASIRIVHGCVKVADANDADYDSFYYSGTIIDRCDEYAFETGLGRNRVEHESLHLAKRHIDANTERN